MNGDAGAVRFSTTAPDIGYLREATTHFPAANPRASTTMRQKPIYSNTAVLELINRFPALTIFSETELRRMLYSGDFLKLVRLSPGEALIREGSVGKWVFVLLSGSMLVSKSGATISRIEKQGDVIGEMGAMLSEPRSATVTAETESALLGVNISVIEDLSNGEKNDYMVRLREYFAPIIAERAGTVREADRLIEEIKRKESELAALKTRLERLNMGAGKSLMQLLLEDKA